MATKKKQPRKLDLKAGRAALNADLKAAFAEGRVAKGLVQHSKEEG